MVSHKVDTQQLIDSNSFTVGMKSILFECPPKNTFTVSNEM